MYVEYFEFRDADRQTFLSLLNKLLAVLQKLFEIFAAAQKFSWNVKFNSVFCSAAKIAKYFKMIIDLQYILYILNVEDNDVLLHIVIILHSSFPRS